jgi:hypothetical protein
VPRKCISHMIVNPGDRRSNQFYFTAKSITIHRSYLSNNHEF